MDILFRRVDEGALVRAAAALGYVFVERMPDSVTIEVVSPFVLFIVH